MGSEMCIRDSCTLDFTPKAGVGDGTACASGWVREIAGGCGLLFVLEEKPCQPPTVVSRPGGVARQAEYVKPGLSEGMSRAVVLRNELVVDDILSWRDGLGRPCEPFLPPLSSFMNWRAACDCVSVAMRPGRVDVYLELSGISPQGWTYIRVHVALRQGGRGYREGRGDWGRGLRCLREIHVWLNCRTACGTAKAWRRERTRNCQ